jgi:hypothetical protein
MDHSPLPVDVHSPRVTIISFHIDESGRDSVTPLEEALPVGG